MSNAANISAFDRMGLTLFIAISLHAVVILGVGFTLDQAKKLPPADRTLEIVVVHNKVKNKEPEKADFLAQNSQQGGGTKEKAERPTTDSLQPVTKQSHKPSRVNTPPTPPPQQVKTPRKQLVSTKAKARKKTKPTPKRPKKKTRRINTAQLIASTNQEISRLTAELNRKTKAYAKRPRRKFVSASTKEYKYSNYLDAWRRKVERIGNINYPDEARRKKLYGHLVLHVALRANGTIFEIRVRKSSGHKVLDDAAIRIVRLAAPYAPFPAEIRKEVDVLDITRTWQFLSSNRLLSK
jgi:periplasmic protein TonB